MVAAEFGGSLSAGPGAPPTPAPYGTASRLTKAAGQRGLLLLSAGARCAVTQTLRPAWFPTNPLVHPPAYSRLPLAGWLVARLQAPGRRFASCPPSTSARPRWTRGWRCSRRRWATCSPTVAAVVVVVRAAADDNRVGAVPG